MCTENNVSAPNSVAIQVNKTLPIFPSFLLLLVVLSHHHRLNHSTSISKTCNKAALILAPAYFIYMWFSIVLSLVSEYLLSNM